MNINTNMLRSRKLPTAIAATVVLAGAGWFTGEIASYLPPEVSLSLAAIAGLIWLAMIDYRDGAPRGINRGIARRFRGVFVRSRPKVSSH